MKCLMCFNLVKTYVNTGTTPLITHLATKHTNEYAKLRDELDEHSGKRQKINQDYLPLDSDRSQYLTNMVFKLITRELLPLCLVESPDLKDIMQHVEPAYKLPSRKHFTEKLLSQKYDEARLQVKVRFNETKFVSITTDNWTSVANESYITVTAHFITANFEMVNLNLTTYEFPGSHTGNRIHEQLESICNDWNILDKLVCITTDNASAALNGARDFDGVESFGCFAYKINLSVTSGTRSHSDTIANVRKFIAHVRRSTLAFEEIKVEQKKINRTERKLILDVSTRWNSTYYMLLRLVDEKIPVSAFLLKKKIAKRLKDEDDDSLIINWQTIEAITKILKPFDTATKELSFEGKPTMSILLPTFMQLLRLLETNASNLIVKEIQDAIWDDFIERCRDLFHSKVVQLATILD
ncbi:unnamed protein product, partial [Didymodactylos carnosus]